MTNIKEQGNLNVAQGRPAFLALLQRGRVEASDVAQLQREVFRDRSLSRIEVEDLFGIDAVVQPDFDAWTEFFVEAVTDHLVWDIRPTGVLEEAQARWLIQKVDVAKTGACFALLVNILEEAHRVPHWFGGAVKTRAVAQWPALMASIDRSAAMHLS